MDSEPPKTGRRTFLAFGVSAVLAGCVGGNGNGDSSNSTTMRDHKSQPSSTIPTTMPGQPPTSASPAPTTETTDRRGTATGVVTMRPNSGEPQTTATIHDATGPPSDESAAIRVWNDAETRREITVGVAEGTADTSVFHETYRIESDAYVEIGVPTVGKYVVSVGLDGSKPTTIDFPVDVCNGQILRVAVRPDGTVVSTEESTAMACRTVTTMDTTTD